MEVVRGTAADRKGGHLALHHGRLVLRETAQVPDGDDSFADVDRWRFYNTNNLWVDLRALRPRSALELPLIVNRKPVDPRDPSRPRCCSWRPRWAPRSGRSTAPAPLRCRARASRRSRPPTTCCWCAPTPTRWATTACSTPRFGGDPPVVTLGPTLRRLDDFDAHFAGGLPSLRDRDAFTVRAAFGPGA